LQLIAVAFFAKTSHSLLDAARETD